MSALGAWQNGSNLLLKVLPGFFLFVHKFSVFLSCTLFPVIASVLPVPERNRWKRWDLIMVWRKRDLIRDGRLWKESTELQAWRKQQYRNYMLMIMTCLKMNADIGRIHRKIQGMRKEAVTLMRTLRFPEFL